ncbi:MAG: 3'-5' exonuclease, partial [Rhodospirillales bacterium]
EGFLHWLERGDIEIKREMERGRNEVRVLTVHGAKGLEAPIVFLPDTCSMPRAQMDDQVQWKTDDGGGFALWRMRKEDEDDLARAMREAAREETLREHRRLLYVAMTRARDRLYVAGWEGKQKRPEGCWYDLVAPVVESLGAEVTLPTGETAWRIETPQKAAPDGDATRAAGAGEAKPPAWALRPPKPEPEPSRPLAPSAPADEDHPVFSPLGPDGGARFRRGTVIHRLLQSLPDVAPEAREAAARAYLDRPAMGLEPAELDDIVAETMAVLADPALGPLFGPGSLAEVPITGVVEGREGPRVLLGQVDRLLVTADTVTVVDYKTNRPPPEKARDVDPRYLRQMAAYREALRGVYPGRAVNGVLLWTAGPRLMPLSDGILDAHAP